VPSSSALTNSTKQSPWDDDSRSARQKLPALRETENNVFFYVLLSVQPCIIFFKRSQLGAHYFLVYSFHLSTCFGKLCAHHQENLLYLCDTGIFTLYGWLSGLLVPTSRPDSHPYRVKIPVSHRYSKFSWWWSHSFSKHVERWNE